MSTGDATRITYRMTGTGWIVGSRGGAAVLAFTAALVAAAGLLLGTGGAPAGDHRGTAAKVVAVPGGLLRVDDVSADRPMTAKDMGGMPMPHGPNMRHVPNGYRRFTVAVTLFARGEKGMHVTPDRFRISASGMSPSAPIDDDRDDVHVPAGTSYPRELTFDIKQAATTAQLTMRGAERSITVALGPAAAASGHAHR